MTQKSIAGTLDEAAARAEMINMTAATDKQVWFLAGLMAKAGDEETYKEYLMNSRAVLTKKDASKLIDRYLKG